MDIQFIILVPAHWTARNVKESSAVTLCKEKVRRNFQQVQNRTGCYLTLLGSEQGPQKVAKNEIPMPRKDYEKMMLFLVQFGALNSMVMMATLVRLFTRGINPKLYENS